MSMTFTGERLAVSVIEARNVAADLSIDPEFYVKLRAGQCVVSTNKIAGTVTPNFMTDVRLELQNSQVDVLQVELLQAGPSGDLVLGGAEVPVRDLIGKGTLLHWLDLLNNAGEVGGELFIVMRYSSGSPSRPLSPMVRAQIPAEVRESSQQLKLSPNLFPSKKHARKSLDTSKAIPSTKVQDPKPQQQPSLSPPPREMLRSELTNSTSEPSAAPAAAAGSMPSIRGSKASSSSHSRRRRRQLPLPLMVAGGVLLGALGYMLNVKPKYIEVPDGEELCTVGVCSTRELARAQQGGRHVVELDDLLAPIYPGDRLRIQ